MYYWKNGTKYYRLQYQQNLFGGIDVVCNWGRAGTKRGGYKIIPCETQNDINQFIATTKKRRKYRGYILISGSDSLEG
jgi:predicted DNA-binding WGR domain protein